MINRCIAERALADVPVVFADALVNFQVGVTLPPIAPTKVGVGETGKASLADPVEGGAPTALLYGLVQSGKTIGMILTTSLCIDNGFRSVVVLTSNNVALVRQTASRFKALDGPRVFSSVKDDFYEWEGQGEQLVEEWRPTGSCWYARRTRSISRRSSPSSSGSPRRPIRR